MAAGDNEGIGVDPSRQLVAADHQDGDAAFRRRVCLEEVAGDGGTPHPDNDDLVDLAVSIRKRKILDSPPCFEALLGEAADPIEGAIRIETLPQGRVVELTLGHGS